MRRREFVNQMLAGGVLLGGEGKMAVHQAGPPPQGAPADTAATVFVERPVSGKPHQGKVLAAIQPHTDDVPIFAGGTVAKLVA